MPKLTVHTSITSGDAGLSLRGNCCTSADIDTLQAAFEQLPPLASRQLWVDCRQVLALTYQGQRALLWADNIARAAGTTVYWCGFTATILTQLSESGLALLLHLLPAGSYRGPVQLLDTREPAAPRNSGPL